MKLRELDEEWVRLRKKSVTLDEEINELEIEVAEAGREKLRMLGPSLADSTTTLERVLTVL